MAVSRVSELPHLIAQPGFVVFSGGGGGGGGVMTKEDSRATLSHSMLLGAHSKETDSGKRDPTTHRGV